MNHTKKILLIALAMLLLSDSNIYSWGPGPVGGYWEWNGVDTPIDSAHSPATQVAPSVSLAGPVIISNGGQLKLDTGKTLYTNTGTITIDSGGKLQVYGTLYVDAGVALTNNGELDLEEAGYLYVGRTGANASIANSGTVNLRSSMGTSRGITLGYLGGYTGTLNNYSGTINVTNLNYILVGGSAPGTLNLSGGTIKFALSGYFYNGSASATGAINVSGSGILEISGGLSRNFKSGTISQTGGTIKLNGGGLFNGSSTGPGVTASISLSGGTFNHSSGEIYNGNGSPATIEVKTSGRYAQSGGTVYNTHNNLGTLYVKDNAKFIVSGGTLINNFFSPHNGNIQLQNSGILEVAGGNIQNGTALSSCGLYLHDSSMLIMTAGNIYAYASPGTNQITMDFADTPTFQMQGGTLWNGYDTVPSSGYSVVNINSGNFKLLGGSIKNGSQGQGTIILGSGGSFFQTGGTIENGYQTLGRFSIGTPSAATYSMQGGTLSNGGSGPGEINLFRGTFSAGNGAIINNNSLGKFDVDGLGTGITANMQTGCTFNNNSSANIYVRANSTFTNNGTVNNAGNITTYSPSNLNIGTSSTATLNITGGTIALTGITAKLGSTTSSGTINLNGGTTSFSGNININNGALNLNSSNLIIPSGSAISNSDSGTLLINTGRTLTNNGVLLTSGSFVKLGSYIDNGLTVDTSTAFCSIPAGSSVTIPNGATLSIPKSNSLFLDGILNNLSSSSIEVSGNLFVNNTLNNGGGTPGTINVNGTGKVFVVGGSIINGNAGSAINVTRGGIVNNYYGIINTTQGSFSINSGGRFYNVRGNYPANITFNAGSSGLESDEVYLTENLALDYTWTITKKAVINGQGHVITFNSNNGIIKIAKNASLMLRDVVIQNVSANQIRCLDTYSTLSLDKCTWLLDGNYSFTKGRMYISGDWNIVGNNHSFSYQSRKESSLAADANINIVDTTFIYDINISNTLFNPLSSKSSICLQNSTLQASQSWKPGAGTILTAGNVILNGIATLNLQNISNIENHGSITRLGTVLM